MAACLITISGTSGEVVIKYKIGGTDYTIRANIGTLYIEDTATDVTYTTISGDAIASSGCLTINALPFTCYEIVYGGLTAINHQYDKLEFDSKTYTLNDGIEFPKNIYDFIDEVNDLGIDDMKITHFKIDDTVSLYPPYAYRVIFRMIGAFPPTLTILNNDTNSELLIVGKPTSCSPVGYTAVNVCSLDTPLS